MKTYKCLNCEKEHVWRGMQYANKYCNNKCQKEFEYKKYIVEWKEGTKDGRKGKLQTSAHVKRYILEKQNYKCNTCGIDNWLGEALVLDLDHIDGNSENNFENNLRCLCPNCHSQTPTYKSKNIGKGRRYR